MARVSRPGAGRAPVAILSRGCCPDAAGTPDATVLTFRCPPDELDALTHAGPPFFKPVWFADIVGLVLDDETDWAEVAELVTESYRLLAPRTLAEQLDLRRPT